MKKLLASIDFRDVLLFGGLCSFAYGLYLLRPWLCFSACGALLMAVGYRMPEKK